MASMGMIVPMVTPESIRQLYAMRQKMYAAILDENDYLWLVKYKGDRGARQYIARNKADAEERCKMLNGEIFAKPVKSGVQKLAEGLGITTECGIREERRYFGVVGVYCEYRAVHERTGKTEIGIGFCGKDERGGKMSVHEMLTTADTRAYNRAVLRLSAFGDVSAEEIVTGVGTSELPEYVPEGSPNVQADPLPPLKDDFVIASWHRYYEAIMARDEAKRFLPNAKQETLQARVKRAAARRGDQDAAQGLGAAGLRWSGAAQDSPSHQPFTVEQPSQAWLDAVRKPQPESEAPKKEDPPKAPTQTEEKDPVAEGLRAASKAEETPPSGEKEGWDLSGEKKDDAGLPADLPERHEPTAGIPQPEPAAETITVAQAKKISLLAVEVCGGRDNAIQWIKTEAHVQKSTEVRSNQYDAIMRALNKMKKKEG
jgi:hypothetical protein